MNRFMRHLFLPMAVVALLGIWGCSSDDDGGGGQGTPNPAAADSLVAEANQALEDALFNLINGPSPQEPADVDLSEPYDLYVQALSYNNQHTGANFGAGILGIMMLTRDEDVQDFFDRMNAFIEEGAYFDVSSGSPFLSGNLTAPNPILRMQDLSLPVMMPVRMTSRMCRYVDEDDPQFSELQSICLNEILPRLQTAVQRLSVVSNQTDFVFTVTPRMQGDPEEDALEVDLTEVRLSLAAIEAVEAMLLHFCAYNLDFNGYDGPGMLAAFSQGSSFAALNGSGVTRMQSARQAWLAAINHLSSAIDFLESETDYQGDDVIRMDPYDDLTQADLDSVKYYLPKIVDALNSSEVFAFDTDGDPWTPAENIEISLSAFFNSPVQNLKALFPPYTVGLDTQIVSYGNPIWEWDMVTANVQISTTGTYYWYRWAVYHFGELQDTHYSHSPGFDPPEWWQAVDEKAHELSDVPAVEIDVGYTAYLNAGQHTLETARDWYAYMDAHARYVPVITWQATSFEQWIFPDPTMGGLFPGMTDARLKELFGMSADNWQRTSTWYLW